MKKIFSTLLIVCTLCAALATQAFAVSGETTTTDSALGTSSDEVTNPMPREFNRNYEDYYTIDGDVVIVTDDPNWDICDDRHDTVAMTESSGPSKCIVRVQYMEDGGEKWTDTDARYVELGGAAANFTIPENNTFRVLAWAVEGNDGYATMNVILK